MATPDSRSLRHFAASGEGRPWHFTARAAQRPGGDPRSLVDFRRHPAILAGFSEKNPSISIIMTIFLDVF
jgi:hypothetical protein